MPRVVWSGREVEERTASVRDTAEEAAEMGGVVAGELGDEGKGDEAGVKKGSSNSSECRRSSCAEVDKREGVGMFEETDLERFFGCSTVTVRILDVAYVVRCRWGRVTLRWPSKDLLEKGWLDHRRQRGEGKWKGGRRKVGGQKMG